MSSVHFTVRALFAGLLTCPRSFGFRFNALQITPRGERTSLLRVQRDERANENGGTAFLRTAALTSVGAVIFSLAGAFATEEK